MIRCVIICGGLLTAVWSAAAAPGAANELTWEGRTMGTFYFVKLAGVAPDVKLTAELRDGVEQRFAEINRQLSHYQPDSELSRFGSHSSTAPFKVSAPFAHVIRHSLTVWRESSGAFDPTLGALINLWGFGPAGATGRVPTDAEIAAAQRVCGSRHLHVTADDELQKDIPGLQLNLSGVAKGYGADEAARFLRERGYTNIFVSVCGEIVAFGFNSEGQPWQVGIERPLYGSPPGTALSAIVPLSGRALSTSGDTHNFFRDEHGQSFAERFRAASAANEWPTAVRLAHTFKGLAQSIGARDLGWIAGRLERAALAHDIAGVGALENELARELARVMGGLSGLEEVAEADAGHRRILPRAGRCRPAAAG